jgi:hypothetical protein
LRRELAPREIFMSATLEPLRSSLGGEWVEMPPVFRPDALVKAPIVGADSHTLGPETLRSIVDSPGRPPLTLVLYHSRKAAQAAAEGLARGTYWLQAPDNDSFSLQNAPKAGVVISYGGWTGFDRPGSKWLVLGSAPVSPLPVWAAGNWNNVEKTSADKMRLAQGIGRALRCETDRAVLIWQDHRSFRSLGLTI